METFSGLVLDRQDDPHGTLLQDQGIKVASGPVDYSRVPDHLFALCMQQGDEQMRKYAMHTPDAVAESVAYFLKCGHRLPEPAQKHAAQNLVEGLSWYRLQPPEPLHKVAFLGAALRGAVPRLKQFGTNLIQKPLETLGGVAGTAMTGLSLVNTANEVKNNLSQSGAAKGNIQPLNTFGG